MITTILFDLDGTLLPMDQDLFINDYATRLAKRLASYGFNPTLAGKALWDGVKAMTFNDGTCLNEVRFWDTFASHLGQEVLNYRDKITEFYETEFQEVANVCGYTPKARLLLDSLKTRGFRLVLATNPYFPDIATRSRMRWAGISPKDFELYTTYENSTFCKPNPSYYTEILEKIGCKPEECLMVGNDTRDDLAAMKVGIKTYIITDCLINEADKDLTPYPHGTFDDFIAYAEALTSE